MTNVDISYNNFSEVKIPQGDRYNKNFQYNQINPVNLMDMIRRIYGDSLDLKQWSYPVELYHQTIIYLDPKSGADSVFVGDNIDLSAQCNLKYGNPERNYAGKFQWTMKEEGNWKEETLPSNPNTDKGIFTITNTMAGKTITGAYACPPFFSDVKYIIKVAKTPRKGGVTGEVKKDNSTVEPNDSITKNPPQKKKDDVKPSRGRGGYEPPIKDKPQEIIKDTIPKVIEDTVKLPVREPGQFLLRLKTSNPTYGKVLVPQDKEHSYFLCEAGMKITLIAQCAPCIKFNGLGESPMGDAKTIQPQNRTAEIPSTLKDETINHYTATYYMPASDVDVIGYFELAEGLSDLDKCYGYTITCCVNDPKLGKVIDYVCGSPGGFKKSPGTFEPRPPQKQVHTELKIYYPGDKVILEAEPLVLGAKCIEWQYNKQINGKIETVSVKNSNILTYTMPAIPMTNVKCIFEKEKPNLGAGEATIPRYFSGQSEFGGLKAYKIWEDLGLVRIYDTGKFSTCYSAYQDENSKVYME